MQELQSAKHVSPDTSNLDSSNGPPKDGGSGGWLMRRAPTGIYVTFLLILYTGVALCVARRRHRQAQAAQVRPLSLIHI